MKRVELKRIAELLRIGNSTEEKAPFAHGTVAQHGSIPKDVPADDKEKLKEVEATEEPEGPMSISRKICFVMSFNAWILYFLILGWVIPCEHINCEYPFDDVWETNLTNIWPLTNLESYNVKGLPSLAMFGYADGKVLYLAALETDNGRTKWNNSLSFIPRTIQCNFGINFYANSDGIPDCLLTGYNDVYAFNASNGYVFWEQNLPSDVGNIVSGYHPTRMRDGVSFLIGTCGDKLVVLDARNGSKHSEVDLPCSAPFEVRIVSNVINNNDTAWSIVCDYGDKIEAWAFSEEDLLNGGNSKTANASEFNLLFSESNSGASIDLGCDVTHVPGGPLLLSWSDRIAMVTENGTAWEKSFPFPASVTSIEVGHFTDTKNLQVAADVNNGTTASVYILEICNGTIQNTLVLEDREPQSMEKIAGKVDTLLLKSVTFNFTIETAHNYSNPVMMEKTNFALVESKDNKLVAKDIVTTSRVVDSTLNIKTDGEVDLLLIKSEDGTVTYQKYVIYRSDAEESSLCGGEKGGHMTHIASEM